MDEALFGSTEMGDQAFKLSVALMEEFLKHITECFDGEVSILARATE
jgi:hypothetical protein